MMIVMMMTHLGLGFATEPDRDDGQDCGGSKLSPGGRLLALVGLYQPECHPGGHHDNVQGDVHLNIIKVRQPPTISV